MTTPGVPAVRAAGLYKSFGKVQAVRGLDLTVQQGEVVAFLGPNGAGKTTAIDMILGLSSPDRGEVSIFGRSPRGAIARGQVAAVMQTGGLLRDISVRETVQLTAAMFESSRPVDEVLTRAGIQDIADRRVEKCSGGQQQRLRFAMALVSDPGLLILDEPTTGMDVAGRRDFWSAIRADATKGRTVIFATHYLEEADAYADRIVLVRQGTIVADGTASQIKNLASGRTVKAALPQGDRGLLAALPPTDAVDYDGGRVTIRTPDSDSVVRFLLNNTGAHDLEVVAHNLEEAFVALTSEDTPAETVAPAQTVAPAETVTEGGRA
ncbi:ABC transporter ATP-binding protein [Paenarthrobacter ilicis]|uniref:ABC-2 type transport system ATP-binding protein n=1 Tax=Paenarthrobacter ilicis TaxID=43665 RepID=A0ABX0TEX5_9MICC|nr:ABC transporter ATP-binding protein [Paenarthrobacter ilicis]MBM7792696.1 ABC-2 type transport system ATP-binding protein [Paenarthrobacter ilicis]NIJ01039.1 ABC-2 type transport system ATP-binding protein [Paenarthrobacter ilicis]